MVLVCIFYSVEIFMMVSCLAVVLSSTIVRSFYTDLLPLPNHQMRDQTVLTEMDMMIMIKKNSAWMSKVMMTIQNEDNTSFNLTLILSFSLV